MTDDTGADVVMESSEPSSSLFRQVDEETLPGPQLQIETRTQLVQPLATGGISRTAGSNSSSESELSSPSRSIEDSLMEQDGISFERFEYTPPLGDQTLQVVIPPKPKLKELPYSTSQSGLVYDVRMRFHTEIVAFDEKDFDFHPEDPRRIHEIFMELKQAGLVADELADESPEDKFKLWRIAIREAQWDEIGLVHTRAHYDWVKRLRDLSEAELLQEVQGKDSIYVNRSTFMCAKLSAGGAIEACDAVVAGRVRNAVAVVRPPGHHAEREKPGGFCFFDNVAVAAKVCQRAHPDKCRKIMILDWDVHHGNGVQQAFYDDPNVLYVSLHVHMDGRFYPPGPYGNHKQCGGGAGLGYNVNIPWPCHGMTDGDYLFAFQRVVMPIAQEFGPDLVIISAGFDAAEGDELGGCHVSPAGYAHMTHMLMSLANGKVAVCLEGGYNLRSIAKSALAVTRTLMGEPPDRLLDSTPTPAGVDTTHLVIRQQSRFWKRIFPIDVGTILKNRIGGIATADRMDNVVRRFQVETMWEKHKMRPLPIMRQKLSKAYENQVLATPNYEEAVPLLVILHDPPEVLGTPNGRTGKLELHNTWLADESKAYVDWAVEQGFAVMDVNIPNHYTESNDSVDYVETEDRDARAAATRELCTYLWQNYICPNEAQFLFFLGIGDAYSGLMHLLGADDNISDSTDFIYSFVADNTLQSVKKQSDDGLLTDWYRKHSLIFVSESHAVWSPDRIRKASKKYGQLVKSSKSNLNEMLAAHREDVFAHLLSQTATWRAKRQRSKIEAEKAAKARPSSSAAAPNGQGLGGPRLLSSARHDADTIQFDGAGGARRAGLSRTSTPNPGHAGRMASPVKLPPVGTFEVVSASPARSPGKRPAPLP